MLLPSVTAELAGSRGWGTLHRMTTPDERPRGGRETRLLLVTIAVSVGVLLLLARFRFPDEAATQTVTSTQAPLERLAARAVYDELASTMADLERRILPRVAVVSVQNGGRETDVIAPRLTPDRAVAVADSAADVSATGSGEVEVIGRDDARLLVVLRVPALDDGAVTMRQGQPRGAPRYVAVVDAFAGGAIVRPLYVGRIETGQDDSGRPTLLFSGLPQPLARGSAIFTLEGALLGLVRDGGVSAVVIPAETLPAAILNAHADTPKPSTLGIDVDALTPALSRATGARQGVVVVRVHAGGPAADALQTGDVIQSLDGTAVSSVEGFRRLERSRAPGANIAVAGMRLRAPLEFTLRAASADSPPAARGGLGFIGREAAGAGIEVVTVEERGAAAAAGLLRGDLIVAIDGQPAPDVTALTRRFRTADQGAAILLTIQRNQQQRVLALEKR